MAGQSSLKMKNNRLSVKFYHPSIGILHNFEYFEKMKREKRTICEGMKTSEIQILFYSRSSRT